MTSDIDDEELQMVNAIIPVLTELRIAGNVDGLKGMPQAKLIKLAWALVREGVRSPEEIAILFPATPRWFPDSKQEGEMTLAWNAHRKIKTHNSDSK